jgi:hypothetical protein
MLSAMVAPVLVATVAAMIPTAADAQDYTSGTMVGTVTDSTGKPVAGATVTATSSAQGIVHKTTTDAKGSFQFPLIAIGGYSVTVSAPGYNTLSDDNVKVVLGSTSSYGFAMEPVAADSTVVVIKGKARQKVDFAATTTGTVVDVDTFAKQMPIARNVTALTLLAPSAVPGDSAFGAGATAQGLSQASLSGSSVGENVFYVNGLNITNFVNGIGSTSVPFDFYKTINVMTGGFQAEYGRSTGGVVNAVTKSGSNTFTFAVHGNWQPSSLQSHSPNTVTGSSGVAGAVGKRVSTDYYEYVFEAGGPIIKDHLFFYGLYQAPNSKTTTATSQGTTYQETRYDDPVWAVKLDGYINSKQHFELTAFDTTQQRQSTQYAYTPATDTIGAQKIVAIQNFGGVSYVGRYTGNFTDWLTVSAAYGDSKFDQSNYNSLVSQPLVQDARSGSTITISQQSASAGNQPSNAERKFYRGDVDMFFSLLGKHHVRVGIDHEETTFNNISQRNGGQNWTYNVAAAGNTLGLATGQQYVLLRTFTGGGAFEGLNEAQYIQDDWTINSHLNLNIGWRNDDFTENDASGQAFSVLKGNKAWRLGFSFDPSGEKKDRYFGFYGRTYLPVAANTAYRAASNNLDVNQYYLPAGGGLTFGTLDATTGKPTAGLGAPLVFGTNSTFASLSTCTQFFVDRGIVPGTVGQRACQVGSFGVAPPPDSISALNVKATAQDEYILGYERRINSLWKVGATLTYRELLTAADDAAIDRAVNAYCVKNGYVGCASHWTGLHQYLILNAGSDVVAVLDAPLPGETTVRTLNLSAGDLGLVAPKRTYRGLELTFSRAFDGVWGLQGSVTYSQSKGNIEGAVKSDNGQADAGITADNDIIAFQDGANGLLPNDHTIQIKMWGSYQLTPETLVGFNYSGISGRHYGCDGPVPVSRDPNQDSLGYSIPPGHYCKFTTTGPTVLVPRGTAFKTDFVNRLDLSIRYTVPSQYVTLINNSNLVLRADVFNVLDSHGVTEAVETGVLNSGVINPDYKKASAYQAPRFVRMGFDLSF